MLASQAQPSPSPVLHPFLAQRIARFQIGAGSQQHAEQARQDHFSGLAQKLVHMLGGKKAAQGGGAGDNKLYSG